jgi:hypothetical protein
MRTVALLAIAASASALTLKPALAEPGIVYSYSPPPKFGVTGVNAIVNLEEAQTEDGSGCEQRIADLVVDEVAYEGASDIVIGFRAKKPGNNKNEWYGLFSMNTQALYRKLPNPDRRNVQLLVKRGARVIVVYQVCGSGGFASVRDVYAKSAVNNP